MTLDPNRPRADCLLVRGGKVRFVGREAEVRKSAPGRYEVIDCQGRTVVPGFIDAHFHLHALAESMVDLKVSPSSGCRSMAEIQAALRHRARDLAPGAWIRAGGYNEFYLAEQRHPDRRDLDEVSSIHPIKLTHRSGHAHALNRCAMDAVGLTIETPEPPGGLIERDLETGEPNGLVFGMGAWLNDRIPPVDERQMEAGIVRADRELLCRGLTAVHDASARNDLERWRKYEAWAEQGLIRFRLSMMLGTLNRNWLRDLSFEPPAGPSRVRIGGVKIVVDQISGRQNPGQEELNDMVWTIHRAGHQVALHAIEEESIRAACSAIELALERLPRTEHRHRIEHCAVCPPDLARKLAALGIMVVTQPAFVYYHGHRYLRTVPPQELKHLYPLATLLDQGVITAAGSDAPIVPADPIPGLYAAVSRTAESGEVVGPEQKIAPGRALELYSLNAARAMFEETAIGSIQPGKRADLAVLDGDPTALVHEALKEIKVTMTMIDGRVVWPDEANQ